MHTNEYKTPKKGWESVFVDRPAFRCAQHPKAGQNTQHTTITTLFSRIQPWWLCGIMNSIQVAVLNDEPMVNQIPLEAMNLYSLQACVICMCKL